MIYIDNQGKIFITPAPGLQALDCSPQAMALIQKDKPWLLSELDGIYFDVERRRIDLRPVRMDLRPPIVLRSLLGNASMWEGIKDTPPERLEVFEQRWLFEYMLEKASKWSVESILPSAATLIMNARIETDEQEPASCFLMGKDYKPLYDNIYSIVYSKPNESMFMTKVICPNLTSAWIVPKGNQDYIKAFDFISKYQAIKTLEKSPIERKASNRQNIGKQLSGISHETISLTQRYKDLRCNKEHTALDKEGKELALVHVSGFVRNQPYGPGRTLYKRIWIDGFTRGQWVRKGVTYITVDE